MLTKLTKVECWPRSEMVIPLKTRKRRVLATVCMVYSFRLLAFHPCKIRSVLAENEQKHLHNDTHTHAHAHTHTHTSTTSDSSCL